MSDMSKFDDLVEQWKHHPLRLTAYMHEMTMVREFGAALQGDNTGGILTLTTHNGDSHILNITTARLNNIVASLGEVLYQQVEQASIEVQEKLAGLSPHRGITNRLDNLEAVVQQLDIVIQYLAKKAPGLFSETVEPYDDSDEESPI